jgi:hypothetical protein
MMLDRGEKKTSFKNSAKGMQQAYGHCARKVCKAILGGQHGGRLLNMD